MLVEGVTVITCTNRPHYFGKIISNFNKQLYTEKELIIILNKDSMALSKYRRRVLAYPNISVYKMREKKTLGLCLNYGVSKAKYQHIAKFDDDDYYTRFYLLEQMKALQQTGASIIGKRARLLYLQKRKLLCMSDPKEHHKFVKIIGGGTILFKRKVFKRVRFANISLGEDINFFRRARARGFKIYATSPYNFVQIRRKNRKSHTWSATDRYLLSVSRIVKKTTRFRPIANRPV